MNDAILLCDDDARIRDLLTRSLQQHGFQIHTAPSAEIALNLLDVIHVDAVLADVQMPGMSGLQLCRRIRQRPDGALLPVALMTGAADTASRVAGLESGADDFVSKPFQLPLLVARLRALLRVKHLTDELERTESVVLALARAIDAKDSCTEGHVWRLAEYSRALAVALGCEDSFARHVWFGGLLHDVGKVAVDAHVLRKTGSLNELEREQIRRHPQVGADIVSPMRFSCAVGPIILGHHEWWDGSGYPLGQRGVSIPLGARVVAVADAWDAMTTDRPYRHALSEAEALKRLRDGAGTQFDPQLVAVFTGMVRMHLLPQSPVTHRMWAA